MRHSPRLSFLALLIVSAAACGGGDKSAPASGGEPAAAVSNVPATGVVHEILMTTDEKGSFFTPAEIAAKPGDVLRFKLAVGVHNVNFLADSNPGKTGLPAISPFLQLPGQTHDIPVTFGEGKFYFQCDPHAALGMKGHVTVTK
jgi:plastocyanin